MKYANDRIVEFHNAFGHPVAVEPKLHDDDRIRSLRVDLLKEEFEELKTAVDNDDLVEIADALGDIIVIASGTAIIYGAWVDHSVLMREFNDVYFEDGAELIERSRGQKIVESMLFTLGRYIEAEAEDKINVIKHCLSAIVVQCIYMAALCQINISAVFHEIMDTNMAKLGPDGKPIYREDGKILKPDGWKKPDIAGVM